MERSAPVFARKIKTFWHDLFGQQKTFNGEKNHGEFGLHNEKYNLRFMDGKKTLMCVIYLAGMFKIYGYLWVKKFYSFF